MKYLLITSSDAYILARIGTELEMMGIESNKSSSPFDGIDYEYIRVYPHMAYAHLNHEGVCNNDAVIGVDNYNYKWAINKIESLVNLLNFLNHDDLPINICS